MEFIWNLIILPYICTTGTTLLEYSIIGLILNSPFLLFIILHNIILLIEWSMSYINDKKFDINNSFYNKIIIKSNHISTHIEVYNSIYVFVIINFLFWFILYPIELLVLIIWSIIKSYILFLKLLRHLVRTKKYISKISNYLHIHKNTEHTKVNI